MQLADAFGVPEGGLERFVSLLESGGSGSSLQLYAPEKSIRSPPHKLRFSSLIQLPKSLGPIEHHSRPHTINNRRTEAWGPGAAPPHPPGEVLVQRRSDSVPTPRQWLVPAQPCQLVSPSDPAGAGAACTCLLCRIPWNQNPPPGMALPTGVMFQDCPSSPQVTSCGGWQTPKGTSCGSQGCHTDAHKPSTLNQLWRPTSLWTWPGSL